jgi:glycosyltransferase involved in cell wall biosynthesis
MRRLGNGVTPNQHSSSRDRRLALFLPDLGGGGAERVALALLQGFVDSGHQVDLVLVRRRGALLPLVPVGVEVIDLGATKLRQAIRPLIRYLRVRRPHALHAMMWPLPLMAIIARMIAGVDTRIVGSEHTTLSTMPHGLRHRTVRALTRWAYLRADALVAVSTGVSTDLAGFIGLPRERITVVHNPLLLPETLPDPQSMVTRWPVGTRRILAVGALKSEKNYPLLLHALARVRDRVAGSLLILGEGPLGDTLRQQAADLGLGEAVVFAGFDTDPWPYYAAAELFVLSSDCEGLPTVLIEALHAGLAIVSTDCPNGPREILAGGEYGALIGCGDERGLAAAIVGMLSAQITPGVEGGKARANILAGTEPFEHHLALMVG